MGAKKDVAIEAVVGGATVIAAKVAADATGDPSLAIAIMGARPGVNAAVKSAVNRAFARIQARGKDRVEEFHRLLREGVPPDLMSDVIRFLGTADALEIHDRLVEEIAEDKEDKKVPLYAKFLLHLALKEKPKDRREHLIRTLKNLTVADVNMLLRLDSNIREMREKRQASGTSFSEEDEGKLIGQLINGGNEWEKLACRHLLNELLIIEGSHFHLGSFAHDLVEAITS